MKHSEVDLLIEADKCLNWLRSEVKKAVTVINLPQIEFIINTFSALPEYVHFDSRQRCLFVENLLAGKEGKPATSVLERLATWILAPEMPDGVFSDRQMRRRVNDKEVLFHDPQSNNYAMELDGNMYNRPRPGMDSDESHKVRVILPSDNSDMRKFNGRLEKYLLETS